jgi:hypothetical protein
MGRSVRFAIALFCVALAITAGAKLNGSQDAAAAQGDRDRFVGAWRLVWLEEPDPDGKVHRADCTGLFVFTRDGHASVQVMYRNPGVATPDRCSTSREDTRRRMADMKSTNARIPGRSASRGHSFAVWSGRT